MNASTRRERTAAPQQGRRRGARTGRDLAALAVAVASLVVPLAPAVHAQEDPSPTAQVEGEVPPGDESEPVAGEEPPAAEEQPSGPSVVGDMTIDAGDLLLADQEDGRVLVVDGDGDGDERTVIEGLAGPRGVVVLDDGSFVVAESGANRIVGVGGRFGDAATVVAEYPFVGGMALVDDQTIVVTSYSEGRLSTIDLASGAVADIAGGLVTPSGVAQRNGTVYVAELNNRRVVSVDPAGQVVPVVEEVGAPVDVALGQGSDIYVVDPTAGTLIVASGGEQRVLAEVVEARAVTTSPTSPLDGESFRLLVAGSAGVVTVDPESGATQPVSATVGIGSLAVLDEPRVEDDATGEGSSTTGGVQLQGIVETDETSSGEPSGSPLTVVILALLILGGLGAFLAFQFRRVRRVDDDDEVTIERFDVRPLDETFGPCVNEELEVERAQAALASAGVQIEALRRRDEGGADVVAAARQRLAEARASREELRTTHPDRVHPIHEAAELLTTEDGREALEEYRTGAISPLELARRWRHAEEAAAIAHVRDAGDLARVADLTVPGPLEREAAAEVAEAEADVAQARDDLERLLQREQQLRHNLLVAEAALDACRLENPVDRPEGEHHDPEQAEAWATPPAPSTPVPAAATPQAGEAGGLEEGPHDGTEDGPSDRSEDGSVEGGPLEVDGPFVAAVGAEGGPVGIDDAPAPVDAPASASEELGDGPGGDGLAEELEPPLAVAEATATDGPASPVEPVGPTIPIEPPEQVEAVDEDTAQELEGPQVGGRAEAMDEPDVAAVAAEAGEQGPLAAWIPPLPQRGEADAYSGDAPTEVDESTGDEVPAPDESPRAEKAPKPDGSPSSDEAGSEAGSTEESPGLAEWESPRVTPVAGTDRSQQLRLEPGGEEIALPGYREKRIEAVRAVFETPPPDHSAPAQGSDGSVAAETGQPAADDDGSDPVPSATGGAGDGPSEAPRRPAPDVSSLFEGMDPVPGQGHEGSGPADEAAWPADAAAGPVEDDGGVTPAVMQWYAARKARRTDVQGVSSATGGASPAPEPGGSEPAQGDEPTADTPPPPSGDEPVDGANLFKFPSRRRRR